MASIFNCVCYYYWVESVKYDWFYSNEVGEEYKEYNVGKDNVNRIGYVKASSNEDKSYCDVIFNDETIHRIYNINSMRIKSEQGIK